MNLSQDLGRFICESGAWSRWLPTSVSVGGQLGRWSAPHGRLATIPHGGWELFLQELGLWLCWIVGSLSSEPIA